MSSTPDPPPPAERAVPTTPLPVPAAEVVRLLTLPERIDRKIRSARDILDPPTPVRIAISGALLVAVGYLSVHFVRTLYTDDTANPAIYPLYWIGIVAVTVLDVGWMPKKQRAKLERRRAESARWKETIAKHNARVAAAVDLERR